MKRDPLLYGIIGFIVGAIIIWFAAANAVNTNNMGMMQMMGMRQGNFNMMDDAEDADGKEDDHMMGMGSSMEKMMESMEGKSGDEFDKAFMEAMTVHHQGAIEMAKEAKEKANHAEIKSLADDIITAQTNEIDMMEEWQKAWGF